MAGKPAIHADRLRAKIRREYERRIEACCVLVERRAKELLSVDGTGVRAAGVKVRRKDGSTKRLRKGSLLYGANPSKPGEAPHLQRGRLRGSVTHVVRDLVGRVGTNLLYGRALELGTLDGRLAARPWLQRALVECLPEIRRILTAPMN